MPVDEIEVYVSRDGLHRAAIVLRPDGLYCIYTHARWQGSWLDDEDPRLLCYDDPDPAQIAEPRIGIYGTVADARNEILHIAGFEDAIPKPGRKRG
jgi:hypothetical protein